MKGLPKAITERVLVLEPDDDTRELYERMCLFGITAESAAVATTKLLDLSGIKVVIVGSSWHPRRPRENESEFEETMEFVSVMAAKYPAVIFIASSDFQPVTDRLIQLGCEATITLPNKFADPELLQKLQVAINLPGRVIPDYLS